MSKTKVRLFTRALDVIDGDDPLFYDKMLEMAKVFSELEDELVPDEPEEELEDLREGPFSRISLADAVNKLMFELKNDISLYKGYKDNISRVIYDRIVKDVEGYMQPKVETALRDIADEAAENFLDEYISLLKE